MHMCTHAGTHMCSHAHMHAHTHACMHTHKHASKHACTHVHTHTHTQTSLQEKERKNIFVAVNSVFYIVNGTNTVMSRYTVSQLFNWVCTVHQLSFNTQERVQMVISKHKRLKVNILGLMRKRNLFV